MNCFAFFFAAVPARAPKLAARRQALAASQLRWAPGIHYLCLCAAGTIIVAACVAVVAGFGLSELLVNSELSPV